MRRTFLILGLVVALALAALWLSGGFDHLQAWLVDQQRAVQSRLAGAVRALRGGQPGALAGLLAVCFGYGVLHAAGPGHGKLLIGGYGMAQRVRLGPLAGISLVASLAQAAVAVALVGTGVLVLGWTRERLVGVSEEVLAPVGTVAIALVGLWLMLRGLRALRQAAGQSAVGGAAGQAAWQVAGQVAHHRHHSPDHDHAGHDHAHRHAHHSHDHADRQDHDHPSDGHAHREDHDAHLHAHHPHGHPHHIHDASCGHAHGPTLADMEHVTSWRDAAVLVAGIAMRPCTGALFLLILCFGLGIGAAGVAGAFAMGLGTATVTIAVAALAVWAREGVFASLPGAGFGSRMAAAMPVVQVLAGAAIAGIAVLLLTQSP